MACLRTPCPFPLHRNQRGLRRVKARPPYHAVACSENVTLCRVNRTCGPIHPIWNGGSYTGAAKINSRMQPTESPLAEQVFGLEESGANKRPANVLTRNEESNRKFDRGSTSTLTGPTPENTIAKRGKACTHPAEQLRMMFP